MTKKEVDTIIQNLNSIDLSEQNEGKVKETLKKIRRYPTYVTQFHPGKVIYRARINDNNDDFSIRSELSYKPQQFNKTYQRASTPSRTMFYGAVIPQANIKEEIDSEIIISASETSELLRDPSNFEEGHQIIVFSKWRIIGTCELATILSLDDSKNITPYSKKAKENFLKWIKDNHTNYEYQSEKLTNYFADEFAKKDISTHHDYLISANLSDAFINKGLHGVIYPSVRLEGRGLNVAITPEFVDNHMRLEAVVECEIRKSGKKVVVNNLRMGYTNPYDQSFQLEKLEVGKYRAPDEEIKKMLNRE